MSTHETPPVLARSVDAGPVRIRVKEIVAVVSAQPDAFGCGDIGMHETRASRSRPAAIYSSAETTCRAACFKTDGIPRVHRGTLACCNSSVLNESKAVDRHGGHRVRAIRPYT